MPRPSVNSSESPKRNLAVGRPSISILINLESRPVSRVNAKMKAKTWMAVQGSHNLKTKERYEKDICSKLLVQYD